MQEEEIIISRVKISQKCTHCKIEMHHSDLIDIWYPKYKIMGEFMTPAGWGNAIVCQDCLMEHY